jgi:hypothetical protein
MAFSIVEPVEAHANCFGSFWLDFAIDDCISHCVVCLDGGGQLFVAHFFVYNSDVNCLACHDVIRAANSASVADDMTCLMMWAMLSKAPLFGGLSQSWDREKCPPALFVLLVR